MKKDFFVQIVVLVAVLWTVSTAHGGDMKTEAMSLRLTVVFNNVPFDTILRTSWGFSCLIEDPEKSILFDTGGDGNILLGNMNRMNAGIRETIRMLKEIGVKQVAPSHCTGEKVIASFLEAWGSNFLAGGVGAIVELPQ
jgi:metal-dependent hydrolase (beta-lactamase superfamily II)